MPEPLRVAYTLEQCWHDVPGGTAFAALEVLERLVRRADVEPVGVAGRHRRTPPAPFVPPVPVRSLPVGRPWLYETWNRFDWPAVERATGRVDVCHSTTAIPAASAAPKVVTVHDVAFVAAPKRFTRHGARVMRAGLERCRAADLIMCPSAATANGLRELGFPGDRLRIVPWGVEPATITETDRDRVGRRFGLPDEFVLFVGTVEPRKNLPRLVEALAASTVDLPLVVAGAPGWGAEFPVHGVRAHFLGFVEAGDLPALFDLATVFAYPSLEEGFGLPVLEAMAYGTPVVTSKATATEEVAGEAAVLVEPADVESIAAGLGAALDRADELRAAGLARAARFSWEATTDATVAAYREVA
ncbi:MAG: glycosyltransferase family 4 protein [Ilumatobacter sp.]|nr:glycosyltransferase family 4 protein [Ilumatobacter sp.]